MLSELTIDWEHVKTYATERGLRKRLEHIKDLYPDHRDRYVVVRTPQGRWTALVRLDMRVGYDGRYEFLKI